MTERKYPHPLVAIIPVVVLIGMLSIVIMLFGSDALSGGSQIALLLGVAVCVLISMTCYHTPWKTFEHQMTKTIGDVSITLLILLSVGMLAGSWMISGVVPTLIYYGVQILSPSFFLVSACGIIVVGQFVDHCGHYRCRIAWNWPGLGYFRGMDSRRYHLGIIFWRQDVSLK